MSGSGSNKDDAPAWETEETDSEAHNPQSPSPPEPAEPFYQELVYELLLGGPDRQETERIEEDQEAEPSDEEREELPAPDNPQTPEAPPDTEGPQTHKDPLAPEGPKSTEDFEHKMSGREEAEKQDLAPRSRFDRRSKGNPRRRGGWLPQVPVPEVQSKRLGDQPGRPGPPVYS